MSATLNSNVPDSLKSFFTEKKQSVAIVVSEYNSDITSPMLEAAKSVCSQAGVSKDFIETYVVPGAFEIPMVVAKLLARNTPPNAIITLGAIIQGETTHHEALAQAIFPELMRLSCNHHVPVAAGVLTTTNLEQAKARAGGAKGNKGAEAALAALATLKVMLEI